MKTIEEYAEQCLLQPTKIYGLLTELSNDSMAEGVNQGLMTSLYIVEKNIKERKGNAESFILADIKERIAK